MSAAGAGRGKPWPCVCPTFGTTSRHVEVGVHPLADDHVFKVSQEHVIDDLTDAPGDCSHR